MTTYEQQLNETHPELLAEYKSLHNERPRTFDAILNWNARRDEFAGRWIAAGMEKHRLMRYRGADGRFEKNENYALTAQRVAILKSAQQVSNWNDARATNAAMFIETEDTIYCLTIAEAGRWLNVTALNVPYEQKEQVKKLGGKWNPDQKFWYVPADADTAAFAQWL